MPKRDWNTRREILLAIGAVPETNRFVFEKDLPSLNAQDFYYHVYLLKQAGLIEGEVGESKSGGSDRFNSGRVRALTFEGHEFRHKIRPGSTWDKIKLVAKEKGIELTIDSIKSIAAALLGVALGS